MLSLCCVCTRGTPMFGCPLNMCGHSNMFGCPLYIHNTKKLCFVTLRGVHVPHMWTPPVCLDGPCMFECPHMYGHFMYVWMPLMCGHPHVFEYPAVYLGDVWMPPVHTQHIETMLCHTKGVSICPHTFGFPHMYGCTLFVWMAPCMFECPLLCLDTPCMFGSPICFDTAPVCLDAPICLDAPLYVWMPTCLDVWTPLVCLDNVWMPPYIHNTKKACFVTLRECPYGPIHLDAPCMFGCPSCLDTPHMVGCPHMCSCPLEFLPFCFFFNFKYFIHFQNIPLCWMPLYV